MLYFHYTSLLSDEHSLRILQKHGKENANVMQAVWLQAGRFLLFQFALFLMIFNLQIEENFSILYFLLL